MTNVPPHLALGLVARELLDIIGTQSRLLEIDAVDLLIIGCVAVLSTEDALKNPGMIEEYEYGHKPFPLEYCRGVRFKEIAFSLNVNYETSRRRIERLCSRGLLLKSGRVYFFPYQGGDTDYTSGARLMAVNCINRMADLRNNFGQGRGRV